ncbi:MAG: PEP-CTERM sorting domain-containing protein [Verrucomicrobiales bacterium]
MRRYCKSLSHLCLAFLLVFAHVGTASAASILSAVTTVGGAPLANFEGFAEGTLISGQYPGVTFSQDDGGTPMIDNFPFLFGYHAVSGNGVLTGSQTGGAQLPTVAGLVINFLTPVSTVEWFLSDVGPPLGTYTINAFGAGNVLLESYIATKENYVGFVRGSADITRVSFDSSVSNDAFAIDDLRVAAVPEPTSILLVGSGIAALVARARRRRKVQTI